MIESTSQPEEMEAFPVPDGAIFLDSNESMSSRELAISALQKTIKERNLTLPLGPELDLNNPKRLLILNRFAIQVVTTGITSDAVSISLGDWYRVGAAPQILLAAQIDDENSVVSFAGVLTGQEFEKLVSNRSHNQQELSLSINEFKGGIDRLLSFVRLLEPASISREGFASQSQWSIAPVVKKIKSGISITAFAAGAFILGPEIFRPKLLGGIAMLSGDQIGIPSYTRSAEDVNLLQICSLSPSIKKDGDNSSAISYISIDKPLLLSLDPLNEIKISRQGQTLWSRRGTIRERIQGPIQWPIKPIKAGEKLLLSYRPQGASFGEEAKIILQANPKDNFLKMDTVIQSLGNKKSRWIQTINQNLKIDKNLALALLFSNQSPKSKVLDEARSALLNKERCLKAN